MLANFALLVFWGGVAWLVSIALVCGFYVLTQPRGDHGERRH
jgi:hypothetical protein